jgi:hypothetical protein
MEVPKKARSRFLILNLLATIKEDYKTPWILLTGYNYTYYHHFNNRSIKIGNTDIYPTFRSCTGNQFRITINLYLPAHPRSLRGCTSGTFGWQITAYSAGTETLNYGVVRNSWHNFTDVSHLQRKLTIPKKCSKQ